LALDIPERLLAVPQAISMLCPEADHMAQHAPRLVMPVSVEEGLEGAGVLRSLPLLVFSPVTPSTPTRTHVVTAHSMVVPREQWLHARLGFGHPPHAPVERVQRLADSGIVRNVLTQPVVLEPRESDPPAGVQFEMRHLDPVIVEIGVKDQGAPQEPRSVILPQCGTAIAEGNGWNLVLGGDDDVHVRTDLNSAPDGHRAEAAQNHDQVRVLAN